MWRANIRTQRHAQDVTPKQDSTPKHATCVSTQEFNVPRSGNPSSPPLPVLPGQLYIQQRGWGCPRAADPTQRELRLCSGSATARSNPG